MTWSEFWLILHILSAIIGLGPTFAFSVIGKAAQKEPAHANFALRTSELIEKQLVLPMTIVLPLFGTALILTRRWWIWSSEWLLIAIVIYVVAFSFANLVQNRWVSRMVQLTGGHAAAGAAPIGGVAPVAGAQMGPPPELLAVSKKVTLGGIFLSLALIAIVVMMVWKPGACPLDLHVGGSC